MIFIPSNRASPKELTDKEEEDEEGAQLQGVGLGETLQFGPHLLQDLHHLLPHLHPEALGSGGGGGSPRLILASRTQTVEKVAWMPPHEAPPPPPPPPPPGLETVWFRCSDLPLCPPLPPCRLSKDPGLGDRVHVGGELGQHQLSSAGPPGGVGGLVQGRPAAPLRQRHQRQDLQHPQRQLPGGSLQTLSSHVPFFPRELFFNWTAQIRWGELAEPPHCNRVFIIQITYYFFYRNLSVHSAGICVFIIDY